MEQTKEIVKKFDLAQLDSVAHQIKDLLNTYKIVTFSGPLGAGKTTLIKKVLELCGVAEGVVSPTFTYVNQYKTLEGLFVHFDLYRVTSQQEFMDAGFVELLDQPQSWVLIEWPEVIYPLVDEKAAHIFIDYDLQENTRDLKIIIPSKKTRK